MKAVSLALVAFIAATPALAQEHQHEHGATPAPAATQAASEEGMAGHDHQMMMAPEQPQPTEPADPHAHMHHMQGGNGASGEAPPPIDPGFAADASYAPGVMAARRAALFAGVKGDPVMTIQLDRFEHASRHGADGYVWEGKGWVGSETDRLVIRSRGEGSFGGEVETAELEALWSRAAGPWFNIEMGVRHDVRLGPQRNYAVVGFDGLAPYWIEVEGGLYLSEKGDLHARIEATHDMRLTQKLLLQPAAEIELAAQDVPELGIGAGLSRVELSARLRYEIRREFAPYIGLSWERSLGDTARFARLDGEDVSTTSLVVGIRFWF